MARLAILALATVVVLTPIAPRAQDKGAGKVADLPAGSWKVFLPFLAEGGNQPKWILKFESAKGKWTAAVVAVAPRWAKPTIEKITVANGMLRFQLKSSDLSLPCEIRLGKDAKVAKLHGTALLRKRPTPIELERTTLDSLDPIDLLRESFDRQELGHEAIPISLQLLGQAERLKAKPAEVNAWAAKAVKSAELYGPALQRDVLLMVAQVLTEEKGYESIALRHARQAEKLLDAKESPVSQKRVYDVLLGVLEKTGREKEVKEIQSRLAKLDFRIKPKPFAGRKTKSDRVVLVELFTGAQCPPCVAADLAFDALGKTYKPSEVVLLQYHLHVPGPDALTCEDSVTRASFYEDVVQGTPSILFNGRPSAGGGGSREDAPEKYEEYVDVVDLMLEQPAKATVKVNAARKGNKVTIDAVVSNLQETGDDVRLRLVLIEEAIAYKGTNGITMHHHVVRAMPGGPDGIVMESKSEKKTVEIDLDEIKKKQEAYLEKFAEQAKFPNAERPIDLKKLKVIAFVQNDRGGEILQAAQVDVPE